MSIAKECVYILPFWDAMAASKLSTTYWTKPSAALEIDVSSLFLAADVAADLLKRNNSS